MNAPASVAKQSKIELALELATQGLHVFPARPDKRPYTPHGFKDATLDPATIRTWWESNPDAQVAIVTGEVSDLLVIDVDPPGETWLAENIERLACGVMRSTPRGRHLYFRSSNPPVRCGTDHPAPGVDTRGSGGYVIYHDLGGIGELGERGPVPAWLFEQLAPPKQSPQLSPSSTQTYADPKTLEELRSALEYIDPDCGYENWTEVGMGLCSLGQVGFDLWDAWSRKGTKYKPGETQKKCASFQGQGITHRTVFELAQQAGWENPLSKHSAPDTISQPPRFERVRLDDLDHAELNPPSWIVDGLVPERVLTLLAGHGGVGKSLLALTLAAHIACAKSWAGRDVQQGQVVYVSLEDSAEIVRYRLRGIAQKYALDGRALSANLSVIDGSQAENTLAGEVWDGKTRSLRFTPAMQELSVMCEGAALVVVDNASDAYGGDENVRRDVRQFVRGLVDRFGTVLLLAHIDKAGSKFGTNGNSYSGSTAWHNSARSRLALLKDEDDLIQLVHEKSNFGQLCEPLPLVWDEAVLIPMATNRVAESVKDERQLQEVLELLRIATGNEDITTAKSGPRTTFEALQSYEESPEWMTGKKGKNRLFELLTKLQRAGKITREDYRDANRNAKTRWVLTKSNHLKEV